MSRFLLIGLALASVSCRSVVASVGEPCTEAKGCAAEQEQQALLQTKELRLRQATKHSYDSEEEAPNVESNTVKPHLREFLDANTKFFSGVPVFQYHLVHGGVMEPSFLQLKEQKDWIVEFEDNCTDEGIKDFCSSLEGNAKCNVEGHPSEHGLSFIELLASEEEFAASMNKSGICKVDFAEPNKPMNAIPEVDSEDHASLLEARGVVWGIDRIDARAGLDGKFSLSNGGVGVTVYVADTGIRCSHQEFEDRCSYGADWTMGSGDKTECGGSLLETEGFRGAGGSGGGGGQCGYDTHKHGTHCAGTIGGKKMGVAKKVKLVALKVLGKNGGSLAGVLGSVDYVMTKSGPRIWSASLGGPGTDAAVKTTIDKAVAAGVVISVAGGNDSDDVCKYSPAYVPSAITAAASDRDDKAASFTNMGDCIDIYAPGVDIVAAGIASDTATDKLSGTSMACPHVSGVAAVILANNPSLSPEKVFDLMLKSATDGKITGDQWTPAKNQKLLYVEAGLGGEGGGGNAPGPAPPSGTPAPPAPPSGPPSPPSPPSPPATLPPGCEEGKKGPTGPPGPPGDDGKDGPPGPPR